MDIRALPARLAPGLLLTLAVTAGAFVVVEVEMLVIGQPIIEALVAAILLGMLVRSVRARPASADAGVRFASREVLEVAVCLLGVSVDLPLLLAAGPALAAGIVLLVVLGLSTSYAIGRWIGLAQKHAVLVACGNSICGNSAIAAVAPVIDADPEQVASSIAFTAVLGVLVVLALPLLVPLLEISFYQYGVLAGLTVYAVPQVLAATFPVSALSVQVGTVVKLVRVLMLGPVVLFFALVYRRQRREAVARARLTQFVPWFIIGFLALAALRSLGVLPQAIVAPTAAASGWLTIVAMAALGLDCDVRQIARAGRPIALAVGGSLLALLALSLTLIRVLGIQ